MESRLLSDIYMHFILSGKDVRFKPEGYGFVLASLEFERSRHAVEGHIKAETLVRAVVDLGLMKFGPMGPAVFKSWGIETALHIGEMVYNLIAMDILTKTDDDSLDEFRKCTSMEELMAKASHNAINRQKLSHFKDA